MHRPSEKGKVIRLFRRSGKPKKSVKCSKFDALMQRASALAERKNTEGLRDLQKIVLRPVQALHIRDAYLKPPHGSIGSLFWNESLGIDRFIPGIDQRLVDYVWSPRCHVKNESVYPRLMLSSDVVLPTSWHPSSIVLNLGRIGEGFSNGPFEQTGNHLVMLSYPLGIGWVANGNHSIIQGILRGQGEIVPTEVHDMSGLISLIKFDGRYWRSEVNGEVLGAPRYLEFGWVWEIGRFILSVEGSRYEQFLTAEEKSGVAEV